MDYDTAFLPELKEVLVSYKSKLISQLLAKGSSVTRREIELSKAFEKLEYWVLKKWDWNLRATTTEPSECPFGEADSSDNEAEDGSAMLRMRLKL